MFLSVPLAEGKFVLVSGFGAPLGINA